MSEPFLALEDIQQAFTHWRATRGRNRKIPDELWEQTINLLDDYKKSKILTTLGISGAQLKAKLNSNSKKNNPLLFLNSEILFPQRDCSSLKARRQRIW